MAHPKSVRLWFSFGNVVAIIHEKEDLISVTQSIKWGCC